MCTTRCSCDLRQLRIAQCCILTIFRPRLLSIQKCSHSKDIQSVKWLEKYTKSVKTSGALNFKDRVIGRIFVEMQLCAANEEANGQPQMMWSVDKQISKDLKSSSVI